MSGSNKTFKGEKSGWLISQIMTALISSMITALGAYIALGSTVNELKATKTDADQVLAILSSHGVTHKEIARLQQKVSRLDQKMDDFKESQKEQNKDIKALLVEIRRNQ